MIKNESAGLTVMPARNNEFYELELLGIEQLEHISDT